jgi:hypothetical protein
MKHLRLFIFFCFFGFDIQGQPVISSDALQGVWAQDSANFPDDIVKLRLHSDADTMRFYSCYEFLKDGTVKMSSHAPHGRLMCGNGIPSLKSGIWSFKNQELRISMNGNYLAAGTFDYDLLYKIVTLSKGELILKKFKTYKNSRCETCY